MGGQTALNAAMELNRNGALARHNVKLIGANAQAIAKGEDRQLFKEAMLRIGLDVPRSGIAHSVEDAGKVADAIGSFPLIIRPAFTLGGSGGGIAYNREELAEIAGRGLAISPVNEVLIEESLVGWKEFEMEVMRDRADNCVIVCSIENFDPMGIHTGDSITVAPVQTLTDKEFQMMRDAAFAVIREIGVETGGSNIQFAVNPENGRMVVIEMNPRVSRSVRWLQRRPDFRSQKSPPNWPSATPSTKSETTSPAKLRPVLSQQSITASSKFRVSPSKNSRGPIRL